MSNFPPWSPGRQFQVPGAMIKSLEEQAESVAKMSALSAQIFQESRGKLRKAARQAPPALLL